MLDTRGDRSAHSPKGPSLSSRQGDCAHSGGRLKQRKPLGARLSLLYCCSLSPSGYALLPDGGALFPGLVHGVESIGEAREAEMEAHARA